MGTYERNSNIVVRDIRILDKWVNGVITTEEASRLIAENNCDRVLSNEEFEEYFKGLGWKR